MRPIHRLFAAVLGLCAAAAHADIGLTELPGREGDGPVTVFYVSGATAKPVTRGPFKFEFAVDGAPAQGNRRLVVISHGSGSSPWPNADLARMLAGAGFIVAMPEHKGDNYKDASLVGPESWKRRPAEVSRAIDAVAQDPRFARLLDLAKVGMYGMSAGGHTALSLAGGRWSPAHLKEHCDTYIAIDFQGCVGLTTQLDGNLLDGPKKFIARMVIDARLGDTAWYTHTDARIAAIVAGVPFAADFDPASLTQPGVPLAIVSARRDKWLIPRFHSDAVLLACKGCERLWDYARGGHGALLSPLPPADGLLGRLINDPSGFERAETRAVYNKIVTFFTNRLLP